MNSNGYQSQLSVMQIIHTVPEMQDTARAWRAEGKKIGLVPTMGALHEGHLSLLDVIAPHCDILVTSIFVNPTQFGAGEDLSKYPRDMDGDIAKLEARGCHVVFAPDVNDIYPEDYHTYILVKSLDQKLCGAFRHGHFRGVATVVTKLFNITQCHVAVFGRKDYQQALILKRMALDLNMDVQILTAPIFREPDGLAMSSRNAYLSPEERRKAAVLNQSLELADRMVNEGETDCAIIQKAIVTHISEPGGTKIDYVSLVDPLTLEDKNTINGPVLAAVAVHIGPARLIDNRLLNSDQDDILEMM